jgi:hypothetical protein
VTSVVAGVVSFLAAPNAPTPVLGIGANQHRRVPVVGCSSCRCAVACAGERRRSLAL